MRMKSIIFILFGALLGCSKGNNMNVELNGPLTDCPSNSNCAYNYYDSADLTNETQLTAGKFRVFKYQSVNRNSCGATSQFYLKTSLSDNYFTIGPSQIAGGSIVAYDFTCPCCDLFVLAKPIGGEIKGRKTDAGRWLINASIVFGPSANTPMDTLIVNQYFTSEKLPQ